MSSTNRLPQDRCSPIVFAALKSGKDDLIKHIVHGLNISTEETEFTGSSGLRNNLYMDEKKFAGNGF